MGRALLLNASFEPLCVVSVRRAVVLVLKAKAEIVSRNGAEMRSERTSIPVPSVIRNVGAYPWPIRNTRTPSTTSGWLTLSANGRGGLALQR